MYTYSRTVVIDAPIERVFHFHDNTENLLRITPPSTKVKIVARGPAGVGAEITLAVTQFGVFTTTWTVRITEYAAPTRMVDEQVRGPFRFWKQERDLQTVDGGTALTDTVQYSLPFGVLGRIANALFVRKQIESMFTYRQHRTKVLLEA